MDLNAILKEIREAAFFLEDRIDVNSRVSNDPNNDQPIHVAALWGRCDYVQALLEAGADANSIGDMGVTPLHWAVSKGNLEMVKLLLAHGASPHIVSKFCQTALDKAAENPAIKKLLLDAGDATAEDYLGLHTQEQTRPIAEKGHARMQWLLGLKYANGNGVPKNDTQAYKWLLLAHAGGIEDAKKRIAAIEKRLSPSQLDEGQRMAREFKPTPELDSSSQ